MAAAAGAMAATSRLTIAVYDLEILASYHARYPLAGRLRFVRRDRQVVVDQGVHQRRLPHVRRADDADEPGAKAIRHAGDVN